MVDTGLFDIDVNDFDDVFRFLDWFQAVKVLGGIWAPQPGYAKMKAPRRLATAEVLEFPC